MKKEYFYLLITLLILVLPNSALADGGMVPWPPDIHLEQSAQNAIVSWNGTEEIITLSIDIEGSDNATILRVIPLPSDPSEIKEGSFESFEKLVEIMNKKIEKGGQDEGRQFMAPGAAGIEITFQKKIGAHDIIVVKVNNLDVFLDWVKNFVKNKGFQEKQLSLEFKEGVANYLKKDIKYFVFDVIESGQEKESIKPLVYRFKTDFLYYPLLISGISEISESTAEINLFLITKEEVNLMNSYFPYYGISNYGTYNVILTKEELGEVSGDIADLFEGEVRVTKVGTYEKLINLKKDLMLFPVSSWNRNLTRGNRGNEVKSLQKILINEGVWESRVGTTGYFGWITKTAMVRFQEKYHSEILAPINLKNGTGYFGPKSRNYFEKISL